MNYGDIELKVLSLGKALNMTIATTVELAQQYGYDKPFEMLLDRRRSEAKQYGDWMLDLIDLKANIAQVDFLALYPQEQKKAWTNLRLYLENCPSLRPWEEILDDEFGRRVMDKEEVT